MYTAEFLLAGGLAPVTLTRTEYWKIPLALLTVQKLHFQSYELKLLVSCQSGELDNYMEVD